jgi:hypothetical protein
MPGKGGLASREAQTIRIIIVMVAAGLALALMGAAAMFWDRP